MKGRKGLRGRGQEGRKKEEREAEEGGAESVEKDVTGWTEVTRKKKKMVQIFVKVDGGKTSAMEMKMSDKVNDIVKKIPISDQDVYVTSEGRVLQGGEELKRSGVRDGEHSARHEQVARWWKAQGQEKQGGEEASRNPEEVRITTGTARAKGRRGIEV